MTIEEFMEMLKEDLKLKAERLRKELNQVEGELGEEERKEIRKNN